MARVYTPGELLIKRAADLAKTRYILKLAKDRDAQRGRPLGGIRLRLAYSVEVPDVRPYKRGCKAKTEHAGLPGEAITVILPTEADVESLLSLVAQTITRMR